MGAISPETSSMDLKLFTPTERKIVQVLLDYRLHKAEELHRCLPDEMSPISNLKPHLNRIRRLIRPIGYDVVTQRSREGAYYYLTRMISHKE